MTLSRIRDLHELNLLRFLQEGRVDSDRRLSECEGRHRCASCVHEKDDIYGYLNRGPNSSLQGLRQTSYGYVSTLGVKPVHRIGRVALTISIVG